MDLENARRRIRGYKNTDFIRIKNYLLQTDMLCCRMDLLSCQTEMQ